MNLLAIINKIIVFERRQLFGLKQIKIPVRAGLRRGVWWSCCPGAAPAGSGASRDPLCLRGHPRAASPPWHAALHNCTHGALSLVYPSWKQPRRYIFTGQQMQLGQNSNSILYLHWTLICNELLPRCHLSQRLAISEVKTQSIPHNKGPTSDLIEEARLDCILHNYCECLQVTNTKYLLKSIKWTWIMKFCLKIANAREDHCLFNM